MSFWDQLSQTGMPLDRAAARQDLDFCSTRESISTINVPVMENQVQSGMEPLT